jgi:hypothetical protein
LYVVGDPCPSEACHRRSGWSGADSRLEFDQILEMRQEVDRLRALVEDTARWLRQSGHP